MESLGIEPHLDENAVRDLILQKAFETVNKELEDEEREQEIQATAEPSQDGFPLPEVKLEESPVTSRTNSSDSMNDPRNLKVKMSSRVTKSGRASPVSFEEFKTLLPAGNNPRRDFTSFDQLERNPG